MVERRKRAAPFLKESELERLHFKNGEHESSNFGCVSGSWSSSKSNGARKAIYIYIYIGYSNPLVGVSNMSVQYSRLLPEAIWKHLIEILYVSSEDWVFAFVFFKFKLNL